MPNETLFYLRASTRFLMRSLVRRALRRNYVRDPEAVLEEYDAEREAYRRRIFSTDTSLEEFVMGDIGDELGDLYYFASVLDDRLVSGVQAEREARRRLLARISAVVESTGARSVLEVGCGTGRNLLYLKDRHRDIQIFGVDLSPASVQTARDAFERFGLAGDFQIQDMTTDWVVPPVDLVMSVHALEQIPRAAALVVTRMVSTARKEVVLWEPLPDLLRGLPRLAAVLRIKYLDRLPPGAFNSLDPTSLTLLPDGTALNRTTEIHFAGGAGA